MKKAEVVSIQISSSMGQPMQNLHKAKLIKDKGIEGDRYQKGNGAYSNAKRFNVPPELNQDRKIIRDVTLISANAIQAANAESGSGFTFEDTRRNILVDEIEDLRALIGVYFWIGSVQFFGIEACDPCERPSKLSGKPGFNEAFQCRGGLRARVMKDGEINVGDTLQIRD